MTHHRPGESDDKAALERVWEHVCEVTSGAVLLTDSRGIVHRYAEELADTLGLTEDQVSRLAEDGLSVICDLVEDPAPLQRFLGEDPPQTTGVLRGRLGLRNGRAVDYVTRAVSMPSVPVGARVWAFSMPPVEAGAIWEKAPGLEIFKRMARSLGEGISIAAGGRLIYLSDETCQILGRGSEELSGLEDPTELIAAEDRDRVLEELEDARRHRGGAPDLLECWIVRPDGTRRFVQNRFTPLLLEDRESGTIVATTDRTQRKLAEEALRESEKQYRATIDSMTDAIHVVDRGLRLVLFNTAMADMMKSLGIPEASVGKTLPETFPFLGEQVFEEYERVFREGRTLWTAESTRFGGDRIWTETLKIPVTEAGETTRIVTVLRDVSEQVRLRKMEEATREIAQAALTTPEPVDLYATIHRVIGDLIPADNFFIALYHPEDDTVSFPYFIDRFDSAPPKRSASIGNTGYVIRTGRTFRANYEELAGMAARGELTLHGTDSIEWLGVPLRLDERTIGVLAVQTYAEGTRFTQEHERMLEFISTQIAMAIDRRRAVASLTESEEKYRTLVEQGSDGICIVRDDIVVFVNKKLMEMVGFDEQSILGRNIADFLQEGELPKMQEYYQAMTSGDGVPGVHGTALVKADGNALDVEFNAGMITFGDRPAALVFIRDVSERKRAEEQRLQLEAQIQHAQKLESLGVLAGGIAHDFNNLLMGILGNAGLALMEMSPESPAKKTVERIETAALRAAELTNQLLAYSGKGRFLVEPVVLSKLVEEMAHLLKAVISKSVVLRFEFDPSVPQIEADATQIRQVVMNLIINASEAIAERSGVITVRTGCVEADEDYLADAWMRDELEPGTYAFLEVSDTGCGMSQEMVSRIFDPFFSTKFSGRGLGLAAVLGIVRGHKGAIRVYSEEGKGTTFKVLLPCSSETVIGHVARSGLPAGTWEPGGRVLIADDEETVRTVTRLILEKLGF
ncbi:PAS domain S-box protein, partial [Candidatus Fermentibacterales bacterium]|nr:PAS domain S-box protein [Candidatus Fermentibacterales bacterium]